MTTKYFNKSTKYYTKYNNVKRVLIKRLMQALKVVGYATATVLVYLVLVGLTV